jgi:hypothetical protein
MAAAVGAEVDMAYAKASLVHSPFPTDDLSIPFGRQKAQ